MSQLVKYDAMCTAINACVQVDEVKDIRDKAMALEAYARQAQNTDAERQACEIRLRAERRAGQMLADTEKSKGGGDNKSDHRVQREPSDFKKAIEQADISPTQAKRWQKLAKINDNDFEDALSEKQQTTNGLIKKVNGGGNKMNPKALWLWGRIRDFEREEIIQELPDDLLGEMTETMQADIERVAPVMIHYLQELLEEL